MNQTDSTASSDLPHYSREKSDPQYEVSQFAEIIMTDGPEGSVEGNQTRARVRYAQRDEPQIPFNEEFEFHIPENMSAEGFQEAINSAIEKSKKIPHESDDSTNAQESPYRIEYFLKKIEEEGDISHFLGKNLTDEEARCCALALRFYSGFGSLNDRIEMTSLLNQSFGTDNSPYSTIVNSMLKAFANIPYEKEICVRAIDIEPNNKNLLDIYQIGNVIRWKNFSSSTRGTEPAPRFEGRNAYFIIESITGRYIADFSCFPAEKEVLFPPGCFFRVTDRKEEDEETLIYLRQTEVIFTENVVVWIDDQISDEGRRLRARLRDQIFKKNLWITQVSDQNKAIEFMKTELVDCMENVHTLQIIINVDKIQGNCDDIHTYVSKNFKGKIKRFYYVEKGSLYTSSEDCTRISSYKDLFEDLNQRFKSKNHLFNHEYSAKYILNNNFNEDALLDDISDFNHQTSCDETSKVSDYSLKVEQDFHQSKGNFNSELASLQSQVASIQHCNPESTTQVPHVQQYESIEKSAP